MPRARLDVKLLGLALAPLWLAGCQACGRPAQGDFAEAQLLGLMPAQVARALVIPRLGEGLARLGSLWTALADIPGAEALTAILGDVQAQLGADPRSVAGLESLGLNPRGAAALFQWPGDGALVVLLPVRDEGTLTRKLHELGARLGGSERRQPDGSFAWVAPDGHRLAGAALRHGVLWLSSSPDAAAAAGATLAGSADYRELRRRAGDADGFAFLAGDGANVGHVGCAWRWSERGLHLRAVTSLTPALAVLTGALRVPSGVPILRPPAPDDAALVVRVGADPAAWNSLVAERLRASLAAAAGEPGLQLSFDLAGQLLPGLVLAVSLSPAPDFSQAPNLDPRLSNPFHWVTLRALGQVRDGPTAEKMLDRLSLLGRPGELSFAWRIVAGHRVLTSRYGLGESVSVALLDRTVVVTGGEGELERALQDARRSDPAPADAPLVSIRLDPQRLSRQVERLPAAAYGGLTGLTLRSIANRLLVPLAHVGLISLDVSSASDALALDADLPLR